MSELGVPVRNLLVGIFTEEYEQTNLFQLFDLFGTQNLKITAVYDGFTRHKTHEKLIPSVEST